MTVRVFVSGQSNALGRDTGGPSWSGIDSRVLVWNNANPLGSNGTAFVTPTVARASHGTFDNTDRNNFVVWFCDALARRYGEQIRMTMVARGNSSIDLWSPSEPTNKMLAECTGVWAATGQGVPADVWLWHQGEADLSDPAYATKFAALRTNLASAGVINSNTVIILGGLVETTARAPFNANKLKAIADADDKIFYAPSYGLADFDGTHFDGASLYQLGSDRFLKQYVASQRTQPMSIYALVNEGGTPGVAGSGENKILNLNPLLTEGYRLKGAPVYLTASQTYTPASDVAAIMVEVLGAGGGGAGSASTGGLARSNGGGGAGAYATKFIDDDLLAASYTVVIGAGGGGGAAGTNPGANGGATSFGSVSAPGGGGAATSESAATSYLQPGGAAAAAATGGDLNLTGAPGGGAAKLSAASRQAGSGANTKYGAGGAGAISGSTGNSTAGAAATGYGSGGGGGISSESTSAAGGNGAPGLVLVWEYQKG